MKAMSQKDKKNKDLLKNLHSIKEDVKRMAFKIYIQQCKHKHALAFLQWRDLYSSRADVRSIII